LLLYITGAVASQLKNLDLLKVRKLDTIYRFGSGADRKEDTRPRPIHSTKGIELLQMDKEHHIAQVEQPDQIPWGIIGGGISDFNTEQAGDDNGQNLCFVLQTPDKDVVGGVIGATHWDWFYINLMWIKEELRGHGYGHRLLTLAEDEARNRGAKHAYLDTFSFQALGFYENYGYAVFGELDDFPTGHQRYYLKKQL
jgi:GNAT superfamily N-acetyltransferase